MGERVREHPWLAGDAYSLADLAWTVNLHRFSLMDFPTEGLAGLNRWSAALRARPSFQTAILDWEPQPIREFFAQYVESRRRDGTDVRAPVWCE